MTLTFLLCEYSFASSPIELKTFYILCLLVVVKIDIGFLPKNFKSLIIQDIDRDYRNHHNLKTDTNVEYDFDRKETGPRLNNKQDIIALDIEESDLQEIEQMIKDILIKRRIQDYIVTHDAVEDKIVVLKREHGEQLGIYHCRHCGMAFEDEIQLTTHLRMHYMV
jgi:hypothetical protein